MVMRPASDDQTEEHPALLDLLVYFLKLGTIGFGGPIAIAGYMQRDLVERRRWFTRDEYLRGLALAELTPGPLAAELAMYLGYLRGNVVGATLVGIAFILPSFAMVVALGALYKNFGGLVWMQAIFYGIGAAVIGIIARSAYRLTRLTLKTKPLLWAIFAVLFAVTAFTQQEIMWLFLLAGLVSLFTAAPSQLPASLPSAPAVVASVFGNGDPASVSVLGRLFLFFAKAGAFVFGSGLAIVPFLRGGVVLQFHWLTEQQFLDAVAVAMITPGPVVVTAGFIGYLVAGVSGAIAAALGVFLPVYLFVILATPFYERFIRNRRLIAFIEGITAAAAGAIAGAVVVLGERAVVDIPTVAIAGLTLLLLSRRFKVPEPALIVAAGALGFFLRYY